MEQSRDSEAVSRAKETALEGFRAEGARHRNCAQSVLLFGLMVLGEEDPDVSVARYLGGGVGMLGLTCGVVTGAALALATRDRRLLGPDWGDPQAGETRAGLQALERDFEATFGSSSCRSLTGCDFTCTEDYARFRGDGIYLRCADYVAWVCDRLEVIL